jgi:hypothetical protein
MIGRLARCPADWLDFTFLYSEPFLRQFALKGPPLGLPDVPQIACGRMPLVSFRTTNVACRSVWAGTGLPDVGPDDSRQKACRTRIAVLTNKRCRKAFRLSQLVRLMIRHRLRRGTGSDTVTAAAEHSSLCRRLTGKTPRKKTNSEQRTGMGMRNDTGGSACAGGA